MSLRPSPCFLPRGFGFNADHPPASKRLMAEWTAGYDSPVRATIPHRSFGLLEEPDHLLAAFELNIGRLPASVFLFHFSKIASHQKCTRHLPALSRERGNCLDRSGHYVPIDSRIHKAQGITMTTTSALKALVLKVIDAVYHASIVSVIAFCAFVFLMATIGMAVLVRAIDVQQFHPLP
jgi:hypothetical protein